MRRKRQIQKALRLGLIFVIGFLAAILIFVFSFGSTFIAKRLNPVSSAIALPINPSSQTLHQSLTVVDLYADSLLWGRDLSRLSNYGHVDIPRLIQGNVALQVFTSVTKVLTPLMLENNSDHSDSIIKLAILQRWPISSWFSLAERAI